MRRLRCLVPAVAVLIVVACGEESPPSAAPAGDGPGELEASEDQPQTEPSPDPPPVRPEPPVPAGDPGDHPVVVHDCDVEAGYSVTQSLDAGADPDRAMDVHAIEVYETRDDHSHGFHPTGAADLYVHATARPQVLVLTAYEPTVWRIHPDDGVAVPLVVLEGHHPQEATGVPADTVIVTRAEWPSVPDQALAQLADTPPISETYCYNAALFSIRPT